MSDINTANLINQLKAMTAQAEGWPVESSGNLSGASFQNALKQANEMYQHSDHLKSQFEMGDPNVSIGEVMIAGQKANLGITAALTVRNKVVQAYQEIMNMQV